LHINKKRQITEQPQRGFTSGLENYKLPYNNEQAGDFGQVNSHSSPFSIAGSLYLPK
jgi:hypothetical protein